MENVPGMLAHGGIDFTREVLREFSRVGYDTALYPLDAADFGVPQRRVRLFFIGSRRGSGLSIERLLSPIVDLNRFKGRRHTVQPWHTTVGEALFDLPKLLVNRQDELLSYRKGGLPPYAALMHAGLNGIIRDHVTRFHGDQDRRAFRALKPGMTYDELSSGLKRYRDDIFKDKYRRLGSKVPAGTVTAHLAHDCYSHIHPTQLRTISPREAARLQGFPDGFHFCGNIGDRFRQIGNAVPPLLAYRIGRAINLRLTRKMRRNA
jgi:DNA (cytosine-5)-methyltransferase 1